MTATEPAPATLEDAREQVSAIADPPAPDAKPKRTRAPRKRASRARTDKTPRAPSSSSRPTALRPQLEEAITGVGLLVFVVNARDGELIMSGAKRQALALDTLAKQNPAVRAALTRLLSTSVYAGLAMAFAPTLLGIAANHGIVPPIVGALAGMANTPAPASGEGGKPETSNPFAGVDLNDLATLAGALAGEADGGSDGVPFGVVAGANSVG